MAFSRNLHRLKEVPMNKKYIVRLTDEERAVCEATVKSEKGKSEKLRRAMILLKADANGPGWNDEKISEAVGCRTRTVENVRQEFVVEGFEAALVRKKRATPPTPKLLDGAGEAKLIALRLTSQCLSDRRIGEIAILQSEIAAWATRTNAKQRAVDWQFTIEKARVKLKRLYPKT